MTILNIWNCQVYKFLLNMLINEYETRRARSAVMHRNLENLWRLKLFKYRHFISWGNSFEICSSSLYTHLFSETPLTYADAISQPRFHQFDMHSMYVIFFVYVLHHFTCKVSVIKSFLCCSRTNGFLLNFELSNLNWTLLLCSMYPQLYRRFTSICVTFLK